MTNRLRKNPIHRRTKKKNMLPRFQRQMEEKTGPGLQRSERREMTPAQFHLLLRPRAYRSSAKIAEAAPEIKAARLRGPECDTPRGYSLFLRRGRWYCRQWHKKKGCKRKKTQRPIPPAQDAGGRADGINDQKGRRGGRKWAGRGICRD